MKNDWKESGIKKRDFNQDKSFDGGVGKKRKRSKNKIKVLIRYNKETVFGDEDPNAWYPFKNYKTEIDAEKAITSYKKQHWYKDCSFKIKGRKYE